MKCKPSSRGWITIGGTDLAGRQRADVRRVHIANWINSACGLEKPPPFPVPPLDPRPFDPANGRATRHARHLARNHRASPPSRATGARRTQVSGRQPAVLKTIAPQTALVRGKGAIKVFETRQAAQKVQAKTLLKFF